MIGISIDGRLHQWKWSSEQPFSVSINLNMSNFNETHPTIKNLMEGRNEEINLEVKKLNEKCIKLERTNKSLNAELNKERSTIK